MEVSRALHTFQSVAVQLTGVAPLGAVSSRFKLKFKFIYLLAAAHVFMNINKGSRLQFLFQPGFLKLKLNYSIYEFFFAGSLKCRVSVYGSVCSIAYFPVCCRSIVDPCGSPASCKSPINFLINSFIESIIYCLHVGYVSEGPRFQFLLRPGFIKLKLKQNY